MGFLSKILNGTEKQGGITSQINDNAQKSNQRIQRSEEEKEERIRQGQHIEPYCIFDSRKNGFPYDCFTETEYESVKEAMEADAGTVDGTLRIIACAREYIFRNRDSKTAESLKKFNLEHSKVWIEKLFDSARQGSCYAKAALVGGYFESFPEIEEIIANLIPGDIRQSFYDEVKAACEAGSKAEMVAYPLFLLSGENRKDERKQIYLKAAEAGSGDAYYELFFACDDHWNSEEGLEYVFAGAECDDGERAFFFQDKLGDAYFYGDGWNIKQDKEKGLYWYKRAAANGYRTSIRTLELLRESNQI